jgi:hypothetical protein
LPETSPQFYPVIADDSSDIARRHTPWGFVAPQASVVLRLRRFYEIQGTGQNGASMKPSLSRPAAKNIFFLFLVDFDRHLATTHLLGFGA